MAMHKVNWNLSGVKPHMLRPGDKVELDTEQAAPLVSCGVLTPLDEGEDSAEVEDLSAAQLRTMTKDQIAAYARTRFGVELKPTESTKDAMLAAVAVCAAEAARKASK